jgi:hypothetical protein
LPGVFDPTPLFLQFLDLKKQNEIAGKNDYNDYDYKQDKENHYDRVKAYNFWVTKNKYITTTRRAESIYQIIYSYSLISDNHIVNKKIINYRST